MKFTSGQAADLLRETEPKLNRLIRNRRLTEQPPIVSGRRQWTVTHILEAARLLGASEPDVLARISGEVTHAG